MRLHRAAIVILSITFSLVLAGTAFSDCKQDLRDAKAAASSASKAARTAQRNFDKYTRKCISDTNKVTKYDLDTTSKIGRLQVRINRVAADEDKAKKCGGLFSIGDLCAGSRAQSLRNKRHRLEEDLARLKLDRAAGHEEKLLDATATCKMRDDAAVTLTDAGSALTAANNNYNAVKAACQYA